MWKKFTFQGNHKFVHILNDIVNEYLNRKHRTIRMRPIDVKKQNEQFLLQNVYRETLNNLKKPKFKIGDKVRLSKEKNIFEKSYTANYTTEVFTIFKVQSKNPYTYLVKDENNEKIKGCMYEQEMIKTKYPNTFLIEKVLRTKGTKQYVKFLGFDKKFNQWIDKTDIVN